MKLSFTKKAFKTLFTSTIILGSVASPIATFAQDYDTLINDTQAAIDNLSAQQAALYSELALGYEALTALKEEAETLLAEIAKDDEAIEELNGQIAELEELIAKREELLDDQARAVQANGGSTNYLSLIASSESISEFVGRLDVVRKMVSSNKDLLATQKEDKEQVVKKQDEVKAAKEEKINKQIELEGLKASLEEQQSANEEVYNALTGDITLAAGHRDALVAEKAAFEEQQAIAIAQAEAAARMAAEEAAAQEAALVAAAAQVEETTVANEVELPEVAAPVVEETVAEVTEAPVVEETVAEVTEAPVVEETVAEVTEAPVVEETVAEVTEAPAVEETVAEVTEAPVVEETVAEVTEAPVVEDFGNEDNYAAEEAARIAAEEEAARIAAEEEAARIAAEEEAARIAAEEEAARIAAEEEAARIAAEEEAAASAPVATGDVSALLSNASQYLGTPYVWGGKSPSGFDCSGFVQYVFKQTYGIDVGGYTGAQEYAGTQISVAEAQPGDLYFWGSPGGTYHVAIATGGGGYIHASQPGTPLEYNSVSSYFMPSFAVRVNVQ